MISKNKLIIGIIILVISSLLIINFNFNQVADQHETDHPSNYLLGVNQNIDFDLHTDEENITIKPSEAKPGDTIQIRATVWNLGNFSTNFNAYLHLEINGSWIQIGAQINRIVSNYQPAQVDFEWQVPLNFPIGLYRLNVTFNAIGDSNLQDNNAIKTIRIISGQPDSTLEIEPHQPFSYPGRKLKITSVYTNNENSPVSVSINYYYYPANETSSNSTLIHTLNLSVGPLSEVESTFIWNISKNITLGRYILSANVVEPLFFNYVSDNFTFTLIKYPDVKKIPVYMQLWFIIGLIALIIFFLTIIFSLIGVIPQDRLPIQPALVVMALVIMIIALIGNYFDPTVHLIGAQDIAGMVIIHPITALTAGFLVAGGLEAAGAFTAAADALGRLEKLKFRGRTVFGFVGAVVILTNVPTLIAMPCGRILGAALMPAALFFGYRVAKAMGDARMVGVVVFAFIVNAAASCGPSPLGGIGTIGEGMSKMPIGSFTTAQSTGIMICTGVCALFMRFVTPMRPADLSDEDIRKEKEANAKAAGALTTQVNPAPPKSPEPVKSEAKPTGSTAIPPTPPSASPGPAKAKAPASTPAPPVAQPIPWTTQSEAPMAKKIKDKT